MPFRACGCGLIFGLLSVVSVSQSPTNPLSTPQFSAPSEQPSNPLGDARALYRKGDFDGAIAKYEEFLKDHPHSPDGYAAIVRVYLKQKNVDQAARAVERGLAQSDSPRMHVARGEVWFRQGKLFEAEKEWVDVVNSGYPEARAYLGLSRFRTASAMYKSAASFIEKAYQLDPGDPDIQEQWVRTHPSKQSRPACRLVSKSNSTEAPLVRLLVDPQHIRGYGLSVFLNGHKSSLLLDSGASGILITRSVAEHAGISRIVPAKVGGIGDKGPRDAFHGTADSIKVADLEFQNCAVEIIEHGSVTGEDGLIGSDVFQRFLVDLDFPNEKFKLSPLPKRPAAPEQNLALKSEGDDSRDDPNDSDPDSNPHDSKPAVAKAVSPAFSGPQDRYVAPEMLDYTHFFRFGPYMLIPTKIGDIPYKLFLLDTGAYNNFISPAAAREVTKVEGDSHTTVKGLSGRVERVYMADKAVLQFGHLSQQNLGLTAFDTKKVSEAAGTEISGFLGFEVLRRLEIKIDYRDDLVDFQYDPHQLIPLSQP